MRKFLTFLIALASIALGVCSPVAAQVGQIPTYITPFISGGSDPATTAWVAEVVTRGGTVSGTQTTRVNNLVLCLKTGATNLFAISDRLMLMASENTQQATTDLIVPSATQATSTATFNAVGGTAPFGYAGNGTSTFMDTKWIPSTGTNCTVNSCTLMLYDGTAAGGFPGWLGVNDGRIRSRYARSALQAWILR